MGPMGTKAGRDALAGREALAERFEADRGRLRAVAYRMLGSVSDAEDAVQETWLRLQRADSGHGGHGGGSGGSVGSAGAVENLTAWLTTVLGRVCLDMLRARAARRDEPAGHELGTAAETADPEQEVLLADSVGRALLVVLERLGPAERIAFVLHDLFAVPFDEIAPVVGRTPATAKKLASRARLRVRGGTPAGAASDLAAHRRVVEAFLAAARGRDLAGLLAVLDPDVVRRADPAALPPGAPAVIRGSGAVVAETLLLADRARYAEPVLVSGRPGLLVAPHGRLTLALTLTVSPQGRITAYEVLAAPARLATLDLAVLPPT